MKFQIAMDYFGSIEALRKAFRPAVSHQAVYRWKALGVIPKARALELERSTERELTVDETLYRPSLVRQRKERVAARLEKLRERRTEREGAAA